MTVEERIQTILLIEKMNNDKEFSKELGLKDMSRFKGDLITEKVAKGSAIM